MDGFEVIYSKYSPLVFRYLLSLGVDFLSAEELTAETFYRAYINFDKYKGESKIETWLCAIAKMSIVRIVKAEKRQLLRKKWSEPQTRQTWLTAYWIGIRRLTYIKQFTAWLSRTKRFSCFGF